MDVPLSSWAGAELYAGRKVLSEAPQRQLPWAEGRNETAVVGGAG